MRSDGRSTFGGAGCGGAIEVMRPPSPTGHVRRWNSNPVSTDAASQTSTSSTLIAANCDTFSAKTVVPT